MKKRIVANWKMHGSRRMAEPLVLKIAHLLHTLPTDTCPHVVICPPAPYLSLVGGLLSGSLAALGAQDCHAKAEGAHTGDVSASMLHELGCAYVIVGHSERRAEHAETGPQVRAKAEAAMAAGLIPIICIGESLEAREAGQAEAVVARQLEEALPRGQGGQFVLAYEPIWAIGTGRTPTSADIAQMHRHIQGIAGMHVPVLYGGSVKAANAREILALDGVGGALVGGASLSAEEFGAIIEAATRSAVEPGGA